MIEMHILISGECRIYYNDAVYVFRGGLGCQDYEVTDHLLETAVAYMDEREMDKTGESLHGIYMEAQRPLF